MTLHHWTLPGDHSAAAVARQHVAEALVSLPSSDDAVQVASELAANAVDHGSAPVELRVEVTADGIRITVSNADDGSLPAPRAASPDDVRGRGLALVAALSDEWGWHHAEGRLHVWAHLRPR